MDEGTCLICKAASKLKQLTAVKRGLDNLISASEKRGDGLLDEIKSLQENGQPIRVHENCRQVKIRIYLPVYSTHS